MRRGLFTGKALPGRRNAAFLQNAASGDLVFPGFHPSLVCDAPLGHPVAARGHSINWTQHAILPQHRVPFHDRPQSDIAHQRKVPSWITRLTTPSRSGCMLWTSFRYWPFPIGSYAAFLQNAASGDLVFPGFHPSLVCNAPLGHPVTARGHSINWTQHAILPQHRVPFHDRPQSDIAHQRKVPSWITRLTTPSRSGCMLWTSFRYWPFPIGSYPTFLQNAASGDLDFPRRCPVGASGS